MAEYKTPLDMAPEEIKKAYWDFKGSSERVGKLTAQKMTEVVATARTSQWRKPNDNPNRLGESVPCVTAHLKEGPETVPELVSDVAEEHDLVEAEMDREPDNSIKSVTYIRSSDAD